MPYITEARKQELNDGFKPVSPGDLTYLLFKAALDYEAKPEMETNFENEISKIFNRYLPDEPRFEHFAIVLGSIQGTVLELERRFMQHSIFARKILNRWMDEYYTWTIGPYEDLKRSKNGDV